MELLSYKQNRIDLDALENNISLSNSNEKQSDWANQLSEYQTSLINKGKNDVEQYRVYTDKAAKEMIRNYLKSKTKL